MPVPKGTEFYRDGPEVFIDYPFEKVAFRAVEGSGVYRKFYGQPEGGPIPHDNNLFNEALLAGERISAEDYARK